MFTFSHVTSIGISKEEYEKRLANEESNLVKTETKFYREIATEITVPVSADELSALAAKAQGTTDTDEKVKLGDKTFVMPKIVKDYIVGLKLSVNQTVQAAERDGGTEWKAILDKIVNLDLMKVREVGSDQHTAMKLLVSGKAKDGKAFVEKWLQENPQSDE